MSEIPLGVPMDKIDQKEKTESTAAAPFFPLTIARETVDNQRINDSIGVIKALVNKFSDTADYAAKNVTDAKVLAKEVGIKMGGGSSHRKKRKTKRKGRKKRKTKRNTKRKGRKKRKTKRTKKI